MVDMKTLSDYHTSDAAKRFLKKRHASESRFKFFGALAVSLAVLALLTLALSIGSKALKALSEYDVTLNIAFADDSFDKSTAIKDFQRPLIEQGLMSESSIIRREFRGQVSAAVDAGFLTKVPNLTDEQQGDALDLLSDGAIDSTYEAADPEGSRAFAGGRLDDFIVQLSDDAQLYYKGAFGRMRFEDTAGILSLVEKPDGGVDLLDAANDFDGALALVKEGLRQNAALLQRDALRQQNGVDVTERALSASDLTTERRAELERQRDNFIAARDRLDAEADDLISRADNPGGEEALNEALPSFLVYVNGGVVKLDTVGNARASGEIVRPLQSTDDAAPGTWRLAVVELPEASRKLNDTQIVLLEELEADGQIVKKTNWDFLLNSDSREAELAGVWGGLVGSFWTMLVTFSIAFPIGVMAAIYLEEFAPKNAFTDLIEVNINNLAAIPSIIFGLFGLLLLLSGFEIPLGETSIEIGGWFAEYRSAAFVGGIVLALMTLPTIIIAARASVRAVPPSIRDAALGIGASKVQSVMHHVLPLAMPGIMTGTIIGMAQALGETAPLLMVGMVGFFADTASFWDDPTTVMPALIYFWSDYPEPLFELKTSLAIIVLLMFLIAMNALAVFLRKRFERRW